eukprot:9608195-Ditylum_brightwellii.AAC.1
MMTVGGDDLGNGGLIEGPVPLQTVQPPELIFEGTLHNAVEGRSSYKAVEEAIQTLDEKAKSLAREVRIANENAADEMSNNVGQLSQGRHTVTFAQSDILLTGDFVDMDKTPYAWALAFPTVFLPCYMNGKWVIPGDYTCWLTTCDKSIWKKERYHWLTWRSDGRAIGHPALCLVLHNHRRRKALQGQGYVALRSEDIDCKMTAEEFL